MRMSAFDTENCRCSNQHSLESYTYNLFSSTLPLPIQSLVLALFEINQIFNCSRDFCWEQSRKFQCMYFFHLSALPVKQTELGHTGSIFLRFQLACFSTSALCLSRSLQESSWHGHLA